MRRTRQPPQLAHRSTYMWQHAGAATSDTAQPGHVNRFSASSSVLYCFVLCSTGVVLRRFSVTSHFNPATIDGGEGVGRFLPWSLRAKHPEWFWPVLPAGAAAPSPGRRAVARVFVGGSYDDLWIARGRAPPRAKSHQICGMCPATGYGSGNRSSS